MRALVVVSHPLKASLCTRLAQTAVAALEARGADVDILDLYAEAFSPLLTPEERAHHYDTPRTGVDALALQGRLAAADTLVLVFPTWWFSMPAVLKGWFDRVWSPGFAFAQGTPIKPLLTTLKSCLVITTLGSPWWIDALIMRNPNKRILKTALIGACAPQARFEMLSLHAAENLEQARLTAFQGKIARAVNRL